MCVLDIASLYPIWIVFATTSQRRFKPIRMMRRQPFHGAWQIRIRDARRQALIVAEKNQVGTDLADGDQEILRVAEQNNSPGRRRYDRDFALVFRLIRRTAFDAFDIFVPCDHHKYLSALGRFIQHKPMARMKMIEGSKEENAHGN